MAKIWTKRLCLGKLASANDFEDVLRDIAELWQMLPVPVVVEGHTKDIGAGTDQFWQDVANSRVSCLDFILYAKGGNRETMT